MKKNIAVIGGGYWGKNLIRNFSELGALSTICDADTAKLTEYKTKYPDVNICTDFNETMSRKDIAGVVISAPAALHYKLAKQALLNHKDIFVEKPLALNVNEGQELVELAEKNKCILLVGHLLEYHPAVLKLKELVDNGTIGKINYIYSNRLNLGKFRTEENILWSFAPHDIDVMLLLTGELPVQVAASGGYYLNKNIADVTISTFSFKDGKKAHIFVSWLHPFKEQKLVIVGDKKMAVFDDTAPENKLLLYSHEIQWLDHKPVPIPHQNAEVVKIQLQEPLKLECQDFINCIETRNKPRVDGKKGLEVLQILSACQESLEHNGKVIYLHEEKTPYYIHESSLIDEKVSIDSGTKIWHFCHVMSGTKIGKNSVLGQNVFVGKNVSIGNNVKVENNVSVFEAVVLEDDVFCGPSCVFTNVINPRSHVSRKNEYKQTLIKQGASIGANATIVCGNTIGKYAFIGAGSTVTKDIPDYALVYGNPARQHGWMCDCGVKLDFGSSPTIECTSCHKKYKITKKKTGAIIERE
jgi:UDP-2-acetamido-3-amino-2,3-dideoxy-glucuronate N-acetyltransferase